MRTALHMVHAGRALPEEEQTIVRAAIARVGAAAASPASPA
ncbi:hypothetical protein [Planotetraspora kaengkrachanensis]|uniref:Uncharacterized protein n=1 Tax=Planotetraspora kaengkrachanensis TaxID=575193 RepID=A0A8J3LWH6_9ACTN|nr:hypothetical protein [Planotetraspora kaengkrachanensis]GIG78035.1 hypothetical protein Pka01_11620 [Planotetraspora kaengkrachanensis]